MFYCLTTARTSAARSPNCMRSVLYQSYLVWGRPEAPLLVRWPAFRERSMWPWNKRHSYILSQRMLRSYSTSTLWKRWFIHSGDVLSVRQTWSVGFFFVLVSQWTGWGVHVYGVYLLLSKCPVELCNLVHSARTVQSSTVQRSHVEIYWEITKQWLSNCPVNCRVSGNSK